MSRFHVHCFAFFRRAELLAVMVTFLHAQVNFLGTIEGQQAYWRRKDYVDHFSVAQVIIVRVFFLFSFLIYTLLTSKQLTFARKQLLGLDLTEASKTNPFVQFSLLSKDSIC